MKLSNPSLDDVAKYITKFGKRGIAELEILNNLVPYLEAVTMSDPGRAIMLDDIDRCVVLMKKNYKEDLTIDEKAELRYLKTRLDRISNKLNEFQANQNKILLGIEKEN